VDERMAAYSALEKHHSQVDTRVSKVDELATSNKTLYAALKRYQTSQHELEQERFRNKQEANVARRELASLKNVHDMCQEDFRECKSQMADMISAYEARRLRSEAERADAYAQESAVALKSLNYEFQQLRQKHESTATERAAFREQEELLTEMRRCATPRPNWKKAQSSGYIGGDIDVGEQTSDTLVGQLYQRIDKLVSELAAAKRKLLRLKGDDDADDDDDDEDPDKYFECRGVGDTVPRYLRLNGVVRNRKFQKAEFEDLVKDIWREKYESATYRSMPLDEFLYLYLQHKHSVHAVVCEWGYNIVDCLQRYQYDADIDLFGTILEKAMSEEVYEDQMRMLSELQARLAAEDTHGTGRVSRRKVAKVLKAFFVTKDDNNLTKSKRALYFDNPGQLVDYTRLFEENEDGDQGRFVEAIRDQHVEELSEFFSAIEDKCHERQAKDGTITMKKLVEILGELDPAKPHDEVIEYMCRGYGVTNPLSLHVDMSIDTEIFLSKLNQRLVSRSGPKPVTLGDESSEEENEEGLLVLAIAEKLKADEEANAARQP
jgi:hypothetical protein